MRNLRPAARSSKLFALVAVAALGGLVLSTAGASASVDLTHRGPPRQRQEGRRQVPPAAA